MAEDREMIHTSPENRTKTFCCGKKNGCPTGTLHNDGSITLSDEGQSVTFKQDEAAELLSWLGSLLGLSIE